MRSVGSVARLVLGSRPLRRVLSVVVCLVVMAGVFLAVTTVAGRQDGMLGGEVERVAGDPSSPNRLLSIKITGVIIGDSDDTAMLSPDIAGGFTSGYEVKRQLYEAAEEEAIKGVVLEINSPGGTIYGAHAIADGVEYYRSKTHKPVYAYVQGLAASGAFWAAVSADKVIADYGSSIGSIGVVMGPFKYYDHVVSDGEVLTQNGIESEYISAGKGKDAGDPYRRLTEEELTVLRQSVNSEYDQFVKYVSQRRGVSEGTLRDRIGAMVYDGKTAESHKLIDQTGTREDSYDKLAEAARLRTKDYQVIRLVVERLGEQQEAASGDQSKSAKSQGCAVHQIRLVYYGDVARLCR